MDEVGRARDARKALSRKAAEDPGSIEEFVQRNLRPGDELRRGSADALLEQLGLPSSNLEDLATALEVPPSGPEPDLKGYLACALTGLTETERRYVFQLSDTVATVCKSFNIDLYEPRKVTDPNFNPDVPDHQVFEIDRQKVLQSDVLIFLSHYPSVGAGQELDFAYNALLPIIVIAHSEVRVSRMVTGIPGMLIKITYTEPEELREILDKELIRLRPRLLARRSAFGEHDRNIVGDRISRAMNAQGVTRAKVSDDSAKRVHITEEQLAVWETSSDRESNPSLLQLRELAYLLNTSVADLVEVDMNALHLAYFNRLLDQVDFATAARNGSESYYKDRWNLLLRIMDLLREDLDRFRPDSGTADT